MHVRGLGLPDEAEIELWIVDGRISTEPVAGADTVFNGGWILPGLVDAHCHVGLGQHGEIPLDEAIAQAETERDVGALLIEAYTLATLNLRQAARAVFDAGPGIEGNIAKLFGAEHAQRVAELGLRIADRAILVGEEPDVVHDYLFSRCLTIAGGTSEIVRNLIAERILGLPRDPAPK